MNKHRHRASTTFGASSRRARRPVRGSRVLQRAVLGTKTLVSALVARGRLAQTRVGLRALFRLTDRGGWVAPGVLGCAYPRTDRALAALSGSGVGLLVNLHGRPHDPARLARHGLREVHLPVKDFAAPTPRQIERGVGAILGALAAGDAAAVHCGGGLGRTGTLLACFLASSEGLGAEEAIRRVRALRPGSVETPAQAAAVESWVRRPGPTRV